MRHVSTAYSQRGLKTHPGGRWPGWAGRPGMPRSTEPRGSSGCGSASSNARVYGWRGRAQDIGREAVLDDPSAVEDRQVVGDRAT